MVQPALVDALEMLVVVVRLDLDVDQRRPTVAIGLERPWLRLEPGDTGLQMLGWLPAGWSDQAVARAAARVGLEVTPLSRLVIQRPLPPALLLGFGAFSAPEITAAAARLATVLATCAEATAAEAGPG